MSFFKKSSKQNKETENNNQIIGNDVKGTNTSTKEYVYKIIFGSYKTITSANQHLITTKKMFPDAYVVKVEKKQSK